MIAGRRTVSLLVAEPRISRFSKTRPGVVDCTSVKRLRIAAQAFLPDRRAVVAERRNRLPGAGIDRAQQVIAGKQQPPVGAILALPVIDAAVGDDSDVGAGRVGPDLLAGRGIQGDDGVVLRQHVQDAVDHDGLKEILVVVAGRIGPGDLQFGDVGAIDLLERGVLGGIGRAAVIAPSGIGLGRKGMRQTGEQHTS